jgi:TctA family transporter
LGQRRNGAPWRALGRGTRESIGGRSVGGGSIGGVLIGALPGLNSTMATALLVPFTLTMSPVLAIALLATIYCAGTYAGAITAILINTPGTPAAAATCLDGFPMAQRGEAGRALGIATVASTIGGIFSVVVLMFTACPCWPRSAPAPRLRTSSPEFSACCWPRWAWT